MSDEFPVRPRPWGAISKEVPRLTRPLYGIRWLVALFAYELHRAPIVALAKLLATFALPVGAMTYCWEANDRHRERIYHAWDVVAKAKLEVSSPARYEALQDLADNGAPLAKISLRDAWLEGINLRGADMRFTDLSGTHLAEARLGCRITAWRGRICANLRWVNLAGADLAWADLSGANLSRAVLSGVDFTCANLRNADLIGIRGWEMATWHGADLTGAKDIPSGLAKYAANDSFQTSEVSLVPSVRAECKAGRPANNRAVDTLPMPITSGADLSPSPSKRDDG